MEQKPEDPVKETTHAEAVELAEKARTVDDLYRVCLDHLGQDGDGFYTQEIIVGRGEIVEHLKKTDVLRSSDTHNEDDPEDLVPADARRMIILPFGNMCSSCGGSEAILHIESDIRPVTILLDFS